MFSLSPSPPRSSRAPKRDARFQLPLQYGASACLRRRPRFPALSRQRRLFESSSSLSFGRDPVDKAGFAVWMLAVSSFVAGTRGDRICQSSRMRTLLQGTRTCKSLGLTTYKPKPLNPATTTSWTQETSSGGVRVARA